MRSLLFVCLALLIVCLVSQAATLRIRPDGTGDYPTIQAAIDACHDGDDILLADGRYQGTGNRNINTEGKSITVWSGSNDPKACVIDCGGLDRAFMIMDGEGPSTVVRGIGLLNGTATSGSGGLVYIHDSSPTFIKCIFANGSADDGGAIHT